MNYTQLFHAPNKCVHITVKFDYDCYAREERQKKAATLFDFQRKNLFRANALNFPRSLATSNRHDNKYKKVVFFYRAKQKIERARLEEATR